MDDSALVQKLDQERWLLNNGLVSDSVKNQLFFCGSIVHKNVEAVEVKIHAEKKLVEYTIYVTDALLKKIDKYHKLASSQGLFGMWKFKRFLKKEGCLDFGKVLSTFVGDYCGPKWVATADVRSFSAYVDSVEAEDEGGEGVGDNKPDAR